MEVGRKTNYAKGWNRTIRGLDLHLESNKKWNTFGKIAWKNGNKELIIYYKIWFIRKRRIWWIDKKGEEWATQRWDHFEDNIENTLW